MSPSWGEGPQVVEDLGGRGSEVGGDPLLPGSSSGLESGPGAQPPASPSATQHQRQRQLGIAPLLVPVEGGLTSRFFALVSRAKKNFFLN